MNVALAVIRRYWLHIILLAVLAGSTGAALLYRGNAAHARADLQEAVAEREQAWEQIESLETVLRTERARADRMASIAEQTEQELADAQQMADGVAAGLRADNLRLRKHWQGCQDGMPPSFPGSSEPDAAADLRAAGAGDLVRIGAECDARVRGLQRVIESDRND